MASTSMTGAEGYAAAAAPSSLPTRDMTPPTMETNPGASNSSTNWLTIVNLYRSLLKLQPVEEDPALSQGCLNHAKYLVTNYESMLAGGWNPGGLMHTEDESKPGYTPDGIKAARASDVMFQPPGKYTEGQRMTRAIESWIAGPFHRPSLVNPDLRQVGFGQYCGQRICAAALDWRSDLEPALPGGHPYATRSRFHLTARRSNRAASEMNGRALSRHVPDTRTMRPRSPSRSASIWLRGSPMLP